MEQQLRTIPSVDKCLTIIAVKEKDFYEKTPRSLIKKCVTTFLDILRSAIIKSQAADILFENEEDFTLQLIAYVKKNVRSSFCKVINATGVIIHTNLGRSVLAHDALEAVMHVCNGYSNLEMDIKSGMRGSRYSHVIDLLCMLTGAEAAFVVNNNAAAVLLTLSTLCKGKEVVIARGQLVEIGGSFRIPEVMEHSGAILREVGCTNRVHLKDYERAITSNTGAIMRVHTSNYRVVGFHSNVDVGVLASLSDKYNVPLIEDLGSGSFFDLTKYGLPGEPTVQSVVAEGADIVMFSGDKVLGGPQAGIVVGKRELIEKLTVNPMIRALRIDKMTLAALEATLRLLLDEERAFKDIPTLRMISVSSEDLKNTAERLLYLLEQDCNSVAKIDVIPSFSQVGGGSFPENNIPSYIVRIHPYDCSIEVFRKKLLHAEIPIIGKVEHGTYCIDVRTISEHDLLMIPNIVKQALL